MDNVWSNLTPENLPFILGMICGTLLLLALTVAIYLYNIHESRAVAQARRDEFEARLRIQGELLGQGKSLEDVEKALNVLLPPPTPTTAAGLAAQMARAASATAAAASKAPSDVAIARAMAASPDRFEPDDLEQILGLYRSLDDARKSEVSTLIYEYADPDAYTTGGQLLAILRALAKPVEKAPARGGSDDLPLTFNSGPGGST